MGTATARPRGQATSTDLQRAEQHAAEAERLLKGKLGIVTNYVKAQVHATLAVYYAARTR